MSKIYFSRVASILLAAMAVAGCENKYDIAVIGNSPKPQQEQPPTGDTPDKPVTDTPDDPPPQDPTVGAKLLVKFEDTAVPDTGYTYPFGTVRLGSTVAPKILDIANVGTGTMTVGVTVPLTQFLKEGDMSKTLAPNEHMQIKLTLKTAVLTPDVTGTIKITSSDPDRPTVSMQTTSRVARSQIQVLVGSAVQDLSQSITIDFGTIAKGTTPSGAVLVKNVGGISLNGAVVADSPLAHFKVNDSLLDNPAGLPVAIDPSTSSSYFVAPKTDDVGTFSETVKVNTDDPDHGSITITLKVQVAIAQLIVKNGAQQLVNGDLGSTVDFGTTFQAYAPVSKTLSLLSGGEFPLTVSAISLPAGFKFKTAPAYPMTLGVLGAAQQDVTIVQDTQALGDFGQDDWMTITSTDSVSQTFKVKLLSKIVVEPHYGEIQVFHTNTAAANEVKNNQAAVIPFTAALLNAAEPAETFVIKNIGNGALNIGDIKVPNGFYVANKPAAQSLAQNQTLTFVVKRKTTTGDIATGPLEIDSDDADENPFKVTISGVVNALPFVCNAFDAANANASNQILGQIYSGSADQNGDVNNFFEKDSSGKEKFKLNALLCFDNFNVTERDWADGFGTGSTKLKNPATNDPLVEWFAIKTVSNLKVGNADPGYYQLATVSDDGSMVYINDAVAVNNNDHHSQTMRCSTGTYDLRNKATRLKIRIDYFQGPKTEIAMVLLWRKVSDPSHIPTESQCSAGAFRKDTATYNAILSRGWAPVPGSSFELSTDLLGRLQ